MNLFDRLFNKTIVTEDGCWLYTGALNNQGYGMVALADRSKMLAHRLAYDFVVDDIPEGMIVMHKCDHPACINPEHLKLGTMKDNSIDMARKGRCVSILNEEQVRDIRRRLELGERGVDIAAFYKIDKCTISAIKHRRNWAWVE